MNIDDTDEILPASLQMGLVTVQGFVNDDGLFKENARSVQHADRWVSTVFHARKRTDDPGAQIGVQSSGSSTNIQESPTGLRFNLETIAGEFPTRGGFRQDPNGTWIGNRWISYYLNVRPKAGTAAAES